MSATSPSPDVHPSALPGGRRIGWALFGLRLGVFVVMFMWTLDKFLNPDHAARVAEVFYRLGGLGPLASYAAGAVQACVVLGFGAGVAKRWTYGAVLVMHTVSTLSTWERMLDPWSAPNLLFYAAWPMLSAIVALYLLRDLDRVATWDSLRAAGD